MDERMILIEQLDRARQPLRSVVAEVDPKLEIYAGWTIKQILAHITGWDDASIASLQARMVDDAPATPASAAASIITTPRRLTTRQALDLDHVLKEWEYSRDQLKQIILEMPQEIFDTSMVMSWGSIGTVQELVNIFAEHEEQHAIEIREIMAGRKTASERTEV